MRTLRQRLHSFVRERGDVRQRAAMCLIGGRVQAKLGEAQQSVEELRGQVSCRTAELESGRQTAAADASAAAKELAGALVSSCDHHA